MAGDIFAYAVFFCGELILFSAVGFVIGGIDELLIDVIWIGRQIWRQRMVYTHHARATSRTLVDAEQPGRFAIFVPAWDEAGVIGPMLRSSIARYRGADYVIFVGCYPNDPATIAEVRSVQSDHIRLILCPDDGPTTKADCLNALWHALQADQLRNHMRYKAVVLHDAEDLVSPDELRIFDRLIEKNSLIQLPVVPLVDPASRWISGHYCDEFAEAHGKTLVVRECLGAGVPAAGVGCAIRCEALELLASIHRGDPFDVDSLTEDYELGLRLHALGERTIFVRLPHYGGGGTAATQAHFPATLETAVRQKTRWITGIALAGWDRLGWSGSLSEYWMRLRDRRAVLAAIILASAYLAMAIALGLMILGWTMGIEPEFVGDATQSLIMINVVLLFWRLAMRVYFVTRLYGRGEGLRSVPRMIIGNVIAIMAARRAVWHYWRSAHDQRPAWDKTAHKFPTITDSVP